MVYLLLVCAVITEVGATLLLKASNGWEKWEFGMASIFLYALSGFIFAFVLKTMNIGLAYAIWSGVGIALVCIASVFIWHQKFDIFAVSGILLIFIGTLLITVKSSVAIQ